MQAIADDAFFPVLASNKQADDKKLKAAYAEVYANMDHENAKQLRGPNDPEPVDNKGDWLKANYDLGVRTLGADALKNLVEAQEEHTNNSLSRNNATVRDLQGTNKQTAGAWLKARIDQLELDIGDLKEQLGMAKDAEKAQLLALPVLNERGILITDEEARADPSESHSLIEPCDTLTHCSGRYQNGDETRYRRPGQ